jgi:hypothetical protein
MLTMTREVPTSMLTFDKTKRKVPREFVRNHKATHVSAWCCDASQHQTDASHGSLLGWQNGALEVERTVQTTSSTRADTCIR